MPDLSLAEAFLWAAPAVGFVVHFTVGRYNARRVAEDWESLPTELDAERLGQIRSTVETDDETLEIALNSARDARAEGNREEAVRLLGLAQQIVEEATPDRLTRLQRLSLLVRMASAAEPVPALAPSSFRLWQLWGLTGLASALHHVLVGPGERLLLRVHVLRAGFSWLRGFLARVLATVQRRRKTGDGWRRYEDGATDFRTLDREHLDTARACLVSLRLRPRDEIFAQGAR